MNKKKILILGGSSDIGVEVIKKFLLNGWEILAHYNKNKKDFDNFNSKKIEKFKFDLKKINKFESFVKKSKIFNNINAYVSLIGYEKPCEFKNITIKEVNNHINANYLSNLIILKKILPKMKLKNFGRVLLTSSTGVKFGGGKKTILYSLSKFMNEFFFSSYKEYYNKNVYINVLKIGVTNTKIHKNIKGKNLKKRVNLVPIKRMASTKEVANYIYHYASEKNSLTTKQVVDITGGE